MATACPQIALDLVCGFPSFVRGTMKSSRVGLRQ
jgi:hypothetical protein